MASVANCFLCAKPVNSYSMDLSDKCSIVSVGCEHTTGHSICISLRVKKAFESMNNALLQSKETITFAAIESLTEQGAELKCKICDQTHRIREKAAQGDAECKAQ